MSRKPSQPMKEKVKRTGWLGKIIRLSGAARFYHDGDSAGFVWRWWHPFTWVLAPFTFTYMVLAVGVPEAIRYRHEGGFGMKPYFLHNPEKLIWESDE